MVNHNARVHRLALGLAGANPASAIDEVSVRLNWRILGRHTPFYCDVEQGFHKDEGIDLKISGQDRDVLHEPRYLRGPAGCGT